MACVAFFIIILLSASPLYGAKKQSPIIKHIDIASDTALSLPIAGDGGKTLKERAGIALSARGAEARLYGVTDTISFTKGESFLSAINSPLWGVGINFNDFLQIPLSVQVGTLNTGGSLSRLRNPELTTPSLFSSSLALPKGAEVFLPSLSSSDKPIAASIAAQAQTGKITTRTAAVANEDGMASASLSLSAKMPSMMKTLVCITGGFFPIEDKKTHTASPSWYAAEPYFADCSIFAGAMQIYFDSPAASCTLSGNVYQQPERKAALTGRAEAAFHADIFSLRAGLFLINKPLALDSEGNYIKKTFQIMAQPAITLRLSRANQSTITFGALGFLQRYNDEASRGRINEYTIMKTGAGARYRDRRFMAQAIFTANNIPIKGNSLDSNTKYTSYKTSVSGSIIAKNKIKHALRASLEVVPDTDAKTAMAKYDITIPYKNVRLSSGLGIEETHTSTGDDTLTLGATVKTAIKQNIWHITLKAQLKSVVASSK